MNTKINLNNLIYDNPIIPASGTFGYGYEFAQFYDINILGSFSIKGTTLNKRYGNETPRIAECTMGMLNSVGLQNPGVADVLNIEFKKLEKVYNKFVFANVSGSCLDDYVKTVVKLSANKLVGVIELNVSCPNVSKGGINFGTDVDEVYHLVKACKKVSNKPVYVKLTPNVTNIVEIALSCERAGADGIVLINTLLGMKIDVKTREVVLNNKKGGFSGPAIKPIAIRMIYDVYKEVSIPIIGCGGVETAYDVIEMMLAGASLVQVGTANLIDPYACKKIIDDLEIVMKELNIDSLENIIGGSHE
ncbi:MAG: dihydroorotate dehydrogenase [Bacilli bacterium]